MSREWWLRFVVLTTGAGAGASGGGVARALAVELALVPAACALAELPGLSSQ